MNFFTHRINACDKQGVEKDERERERERERGP